VGGADSRDGGEMDGTIGKRVVRFDRSNFYINREDREIISCPGQYLWKSSLRPQGAPQVRALPHCREPARVGGDSFEIRRCGGQTGDDELGFAVRLEGIDRRNMSYRVWMPGAGRGDAATLVITPGDGGKLDRGTPLIR